MSLAAQEQPRFMAGALAPMIIGCALFMQTLDSTVISNALPTMARSLHEDPVTLNLAITAYLLAAAVVPAAAAAEEAQEMKRPRITHIDPDWNAVAADLAPVAAPAAVPAPSSEDTAAPPVSDAQAAEASDSR